jgi:Tol biopolymer transport system component
LLFEVVPTERYGLIPVDDDTRRYSLWTLSFRDRRIERFGTVESPWYINATFAPNGRWVAYAAGAGSASRVYVEPFPFTGARYVVANEPARDPFWSPDGQELFYAPGLDRFQVVTFSTQPTVTFGNAVPVPRGGVLQAQNFRRMYDLSPDGRRILGIIAGQTTQEALAPTIQVVLNWSEELEARVP